MPFTVPQIRLYQNWLRDQRGLVFESYDALHAWSVTDLEAFWQSIWDYFDLRSPTPHSAVLLERCMPGAQWFPGAQVNYAAQVFRHVEAAEAGGFPAIISHTEQSLSAGQPAREVSWPELRQQVASLALHLQAQGIAPGDRVAAYLPNGPEAIVAFLATISIGAVWSICAPDMGVDAVLDRFRQIKPKVLIACDGVHYGGRNLDRRSVIDALHAGLPSLVHVLVDYSLDATETIANYARLTSATARNDAKTANFEPLALAFDHPLWIVYSSGTTGLPKPIVHGHGGTVLVALALKVLHNDIGCSYAAESLGERYHWYSSTGWVMWNAQVSGLLNGTTCVIFDGNPGGTKDQPDWTTLWRFAANTGVTFFGAGAAFYANCMKSGLDLGQCGDLSQIRALGSTGSPLSVEAQNWGTAQFERIRAASALPNPHDEIVTSAGPEASGGDAPFKQGPQDWLRQTAGASFDPSTGSGQAKLRTNGTPSGGILRPFDGLRPGPAQDDRADKVNNRGGASSIWFCNISGGTDFAGAFIGGNRELPQVPGEMQCRLLGCAVEAWNEAGEPVIGDVGELVCSLPIPSMPLYFWGDEGHQRYLSSYFDMYPNVWRHGDWLKVTESGSCIIYGRSDATINRHGLRMGTSELYSAIEALPEVLDSLVVDLEYLGRESYMPLFVSLKPGLALDAAIKDKLNNAIKTALSPRFLPNAIFQVPEIPRTLSGKKQELPIKKLLLGQPLDKVVNKDAMANPACLDWYVAFAVQRAAHVGLR